MPLVKPAALIALASSIAACGDISDTNPQQAGEDQAAASLCDDNSGIVTASAWIRPSRAGQPTSAAYISLTNCSPDDDVLTAVAFAGANAVELHATSMTDDGVASMTPTGGVNLVSGAQVSMEPGGAHIMLIGMAAPVEIGSSATLTLEFEKAPPLDVAFEVRDAAPNDEHSQH